MKSYIGQIPVLRPPYPWFRIHNGRFTWLLLWCLLIHSIGPASLAAQATIKSNSNNSLPPAVLNGIWSIDCAGARTWLAFPQKTRALQKATRKTTEPAETRKLRRTVVSQGPGTRHSEEVHTAYCWVCNNLIFTNAPPPFELHLQYKLSDKPCLLARPVQPATDCQIKGRFHTRAPPRC